ncbi:hypothetical protein NQD34_001727 [Periophthalmus magnuspinnatus]|nr:hypothetical protein NQD34_001727 [Periophthalmus magnuspinnatus]
MSPSEYYNQIYITDPDTLCALYECTNDKLKFLMNSLNIDTEGLVELFYIRKSCKFIFNPQSLNNEMARFYIRKEMKMIQSVIKPPKSNFKSYDLNHMGINVMKIDEEDLNTTDPRIGISVPQLLPQNETFIPEVWFPANALHEIPEKKRVVGTVSYMWHDQFEMYPVNISSVVIRIELSEGKRLKNLNTPIEMVFLLKGDTFCQHVACILVTFINASVTDFHWKKEGCKTEIALSNITCSCNHMTPFAVLLIDLSQIDEIHWQILSYISYIGCGLSAFFTALSIVIFLFSHQKADHSIAIHVSLSGSLFLLNTTFLLTEWGATVKPDWVCVLVAAAMHYSLLCSFTWMALEAVHLYILLIKVFNTNYKHYMLKMSVIGWGIPAIIVSISAGVQNNHFYGMKETIMADSNQTSAICWIIDDSYFYSLNLVYFTLIFVFNSGILTAVASSICKMKQVFRNVKDKKWKDPSRFNESCKSGFTVLGLTCLMGTTWGLAFLGSGYVNYPVLYLFCIFNSTQGFFIFIWICLSTNKQRKRKMEEKMASTPAKTSTTKTE